MQLCSSSPPRSVWWYLHTLGVVVLADDTVDLPGGEISNPARTWVLSSAVWNTLGVVYKVALAGDTVVLPGGEVSSPARTWVLSSADWNTTTNKISGRVVMTETAALSAINAGTLQIGTYDPTSLPLSIVKNPTTVQPVHDSSANTLTWEFTDFQIPAGERYAGVFVSGGSYLRGGASPVTAPIDVAIAFAHDDW